MTWPTTSPSGRGARSWPKARPSAGCEQLLDVVRLTAVRRPEAGAALGRPAAAGGAGPRAGQLSERPPARRAARRARPQAPPGDADRAQAHPARGRHHVHLRDPRPGRGADHVRPDRGDERGPGRADRHARRRSTTRPSSVFVANFIGVANLMPGVVQARPTAPTRRSRSRATRRICGAHGRPAAASRRRGHGHGPPRAAPADRDRRRRGERACRCTRRARRVPGSGRPLHPAGGRRHRDRRARRPGAAAPAARARTGPAGRAGTTSRPPAAPADGAAVRGR